MSTPLGVILDTVVFVFYTVFKRIQYFLFPDVKASEVANSKIMNEERAKFFKWNKSNIGDFYYTWNMILVVFKS